MLQIDLCPSSAQSKAVWIPLPKPLFMWIRSLDELGLATQVISVHTKVEKSHHLNYLAPSTCLLLKLALKKEKCSLKPKKTLN